MGMNIKLCGSFMNILFPVEDKYDWSVLPCIVSTYCTQPPATRPFQTLTRLLTYSLKTHTLYTMKGATTGTQQEGGRSSLPHIHSRKGAVPAAMDHRKHDGKIYVSVVFVVYIIQIPPSSLFFLCVCANFKVLFYLFCSYVIFFPSPDCFFVFFNHPLCFKGEFRQYWCLSQSRHEFPQTISRIFVIYVLVTYLCICH